jgi:hypothetical protein
VGDVDDLQKGGKPCLSDRFEVAGGRADFSASVVRIDGSTSAIAARRSSAKSTWK